MDTFKYDDYHGKGSAKMIVDMIRFHRCDT